MAHLPLVTWVVTLSAVVVLVLVTIVRHSYQQLRRAPVRTRRTPRRVHPRRYNIVETGTEREEFFLPGDPSPRYIPRDDIGRDD